jgi:intraflagellar transport protein 56
MTHEISDFLAIHVYIAMCYYKLDYFDVSLEVLNNYLSQHPDSIMAINLKACNFFRLYNGITAEGEYKELLDQDISNFKFAQDLIKHNLV